MFLTRAGDKGKAFVSSFLQHEGVDAILSRLEDKQYDIVYSYALDQEQIVYEAFLHEPDHHDENSYIRLAVLANGLPVEPPYGPLPLAAQALYVFLSERENEWALHAPKRLEKIYSPIASALQNTKALPEEELLKRAKARSDFLALFSAKDEKKALAPEKGWSLHFRFQTLSSKEVALSFELWEEGKRKVPISSLSSFFESYQEEGTYVYRLQPYSLKHQYFSNEDQTALFFLQPFFLAEEGLGTQSLTLENDPFAALLRILHGKSVTFDGNSYYVSEEEKKAGYRYDEAGHLSFVPELSALKHATYRVGKSALLLMDDSSNVILRYVFFNGTSRKLFRFALEHPDQDMAFVTDLISQRAPRSFSLDAKDDGKEKLKITLYVDLSSEGTLFYRSEYSLFGRLWERSELASHVSYANQLTHYDALLLRYGAKEEGEETNQEKVLQFLQSDLTELKRFVRVMLSPALSQTKVASVPSISLSLIHHEDWLTLRMKKSPYTIAEWEQILTAYRKKKKFVLLSGNIILVQDPVVAELSALSTHEKLGKNWEKDHLTMAEALRLDAEYGKGPIAWESDASLHDAIHAIQSFANAPLNLPSHFDSLLRPYQRVGVQWLSTLHRYGLGGILADDMGLGKTLEAIAFLSTLSDEKPRLVVAPKSVLYNWENEFHHWAPSLPVYVIDGNKEKRLSLIRSIGESPKATYIASYDSLRNDVTEYAKKEFAVLFADEAQSIKNDLAKRSRALRHIRAVSRFALTGTPIENSMADLWGIFDLLMPNYLGSFPIFKTRYLLAGNQIEARASLKKRVTPFLLRRTKEEVLKELPPKSIEVVTLRMGEAAHALYCATITKARNEFQRLKDKSDPANHDRFKKFSLLPILTSLREICVDPGAFYDGFDEESTKFSYVKTLLDSLLPSGHKVLIFSSFTKVLDDLEKQLSLHGVACYNLQGKTAAKDRLAMANAFNTSDDVMVMLVSLKAGGTGLNLPGADFVIHLDPWWNWAAESQATDRAYRIGQTHPVTVLKLICHDSIEEKVVALQQEKEKLYHDVIDQKPGALSSLTEEDIDFLLS